MSVELWNTTFSALTLVVFCVTAVVALVHSRHLEANNQIRAILAIQTDFERPAMQRGLQFVQAALSRRLTEPAYRSELAELGFIDPELHLEMDVCNWFNEVGTLVKNGFVSEDVFHEMFGRLVDRNWELLSPAIALLRRKRGDTQYQNFEYLVARYRRWHARFPEGKYPRSTPRLRIDDPWLAADTAPDS